MSRRSDESDLQGPDGSAYEEAAHFYGRALEPADRAALDESLEQWRGLRGEDRTFVLAHLGMLQLRAMDEICAGLERLTTAKPTRLCRQPDMVFVRAWLDL